VHVFAEETVQAVAARIRPRARGAGTAGLALVGKLAALAVVADKQDAVALVATGQGHGGGEAAVAAVVQLFQRDIGIAPVAQIVRRILGAQADHAAQGVGGIQHRGRAAHDLHGFELIQVDEVASRAETAAGHVGAERRRHRHTVDLDARAVAGQAADIEAVQPEAAAAADRRHARLVAHQVADGHIQMPVHLRAVDGRHRAGHIELDRRRQRGDLHARQIGGVGGRGRLGGHGGNSKQRADHGGQWGDAKHGRTSPLPERGITRRAGKGNGTAVPEAGGRSMESGEVLKPSPTNENLSHL